MKDNYMPLEKLLSASENSLYKLTMLVAMRAFQLADGAKPKVNLNTDKILPIAIEEVAEGKIKLEEKKKSKA